MDSVLAARMHRSYVTGTEATLRTHHQADKQLLYVKDSTSHEKESRKNGKNLDFGALCEPRVL